MPLSPDDLTAALRQPPITELRARKLQARTNGDKTLMQAVITAIPEPEIRDGWLTMLRSLRMLPDAS